MCAGGGADKRYTANMARLIYYMDETGNRRPDKKPHQNAQARDCFALGGYLLWESDKDLVRSAHAAFCARWSLTAPLHMTDMLSARKRFAWLGNLSDRERSRFWEEYKDFLASVPALGTGCVISRSGYVARGYLEKFSESKWFLCRSAFDITIERAVKYALSVGAKLDVVFESDPPFNPIMEGYFKNLKENGLSFDQTRAGKYVPLTAEDFKTALGRIEYKGKDNPFIQIADSYIYAIARQKYDRLFGVFCRLRDSKRIINFALQDADLIKAMGIKYYCFD